MMPSVDFNHSARMVPSMDGIIARALAMSAVLGALATGAALTASATPESGKAVETKLLAAHNAERDRVGVPHLVWNPALASKAADWGRSLARRGVLEHSREAMREGTGENLWMGSAGQWPVEKMVGTFVAEKRMFRRAAFPNTSRTGNWADAGHYSQIVWHGTREVGCAVATGSGNDVLVCRYYPAGNIYGQKPY